MKSLFRPTLVRRVVLALLIGYPLVWTVLVSVRYLHFRHQQGEYFAEWPVGLEIRDGLSEVEDPAEVRAIVAALERIQNGMSGRQDLRVSVAIQIRDRRDQRLIYSSPAASGVLLRGNPQHRIDQLVHGQPYQVFELDTPRWTVLFGRTVGDARWLMRILNGDLLWYLTIAFPVLLLPVWLAVSHGLQPLRRLSLAIAARGASDLAPVGIEPQHAELKPLVTALDHLLARLRSKVETEQLFVANAAHELRTPLAVITAQGHALAKAGTEAERAEAESRLNSAIERASHLIHQLLAVARLQVEQSAALSTADVALLAQKELANFVPAALERDIDLSLHAPDQLLCPLEVQSFRSILQNLIDNAIRYGREGGSVVVELELREKTLALRVADDGPGIPDAEREQIFERFYRGTGHGDARGSGLGLTIVRQAAARLNGRVQVGPGLGGRGCSFVVEIRADSMDEAPIGEARR